MAEEKEIDQIDKTKEISPTFLAFSQADICRSSWKIAKTLVVAGLLIVVRHSRYIVMFTCGLDRKIVRLVLGVVKEASKS